MYQSQGYTGTIITVKGPHMPHCIKETYSNIYTSHPRMRGSITTQLVINIRIAIDLILNSMMNCFPLQGRRQVGAWGC